MNSRERISIALRGGKPDRVPVVNIFNLNYLSKEFKKQGKSFTPFDIRYLKQIINFQEEIGHDPVYYLYTYDEPVVAVLPEFFIKWKDEDKKDWIVKEKSLKGKMEKMIERTYITPKGSMNAFFSRSEYQAWIKRHPLENKNNINLLMYRPDPEKMDLYLLKNIIKDIGDDAFLTIGIPGVWEEACALRGMERLIFDVFDDPAWVKEFFTILMNYSIKTARVLAKMGVDNIFIDQSYVGMGMSRDMYREFVLPYDSQIIHAVNSENVISSLHNCGKCMNLLEDMVESGAICIETLAPIDYSGDVELKEASQKIGDKVGIWGGFKERVLDKDKSTVKEEVLRCFRAAAYNGGYILRGAGQVYQAKIENLKYLKELSEEYGGC